MLVLHCNLKYNSKKSRCLVLYWKGLPALVYRAASFRGRWKSQAGWIYFSFFSAPRFVYLIQDYTYSSVRIDKLDFFLGWFLSKLFLSACPFPKVVLVSCNNLVVSIFAQNVRETNLITLLFREGSKFTSSIILENTLIKGLTYSVWGMTSFVEIPNLCKKVQDPLISERKLERISFLLQHWPGKAMQNPVPVRDSEVYINSVNELRDCTC